MAFMIPVVKNNYDIYGRKPSKRKDRGHSLRVDTQRARVPSLQRTRSGSMPVEVMFSCDPSHHGKPAIMRRRERTMSEQVLLGNARRVRFAGDDDDAQSNSFSLSHHAVALETAVEREDDNSEDSCNVCDDEGTQSPDVMSCSPDISSPELSPDEADSSGDHEHEPWLLMKITRAVKVLGLSRRRGERKHSR